MTKSIFERATFKQILLLCIFLIMMDIWRIFNFINHRVMHSYLWLTLTVWILIFLMAIFARSYMRQERLALAMLGISFLMDWLGNIELIPILLSALLSISFIGLALYLWWCSYKISGKTVKGSFLSLSLFLILIVLLLLPAFFFWLLGMLANMAK